MEQQPYQIGWLAFDIEHFYFLKHKPEEKAHFPYFYSIIAKKREFLQRHAFLCRLNPTNFANPFHPRNIQKAQKKVDTVQLFLHYEQ